MCFRLLIEERNSVQSQRKGSKFRFPETEVHYMQTHFVLFLSYFHLSKIVPTTFYSNVFPHSDYA